MAWGTRRNDIFEVYVSTKFNFILEQGMYKINLILFIMFSLINIEKYLIEKWYIYGNILYKKLQVL